MAMSLGFFSTFVATERPSTSALTLRPQAPLHPKFRLMRPVTYATISEPSTQKVRGIMKPRKISPEMQALFGVSEISRTQALKQIWAYIKENNLQDPENKRIIRCDEKLKKLFAGRDQVGMLEIAGLISPHFLK
ncbi:upstream activation factor subunit UAF30 [Gastrolobium bilobum]|uniref:upstream activation factor subunit UAF30 n=1 Tax=Gastrolobium bilobum TaxID=150636 RepID=UPI002AB18853|nr:upstream activation factor subunit UAF30 [Gastrolobium bilobum]